MQSSFNSREVNKMAAKALAKVNPDVLRFAREEIGMSIEVAAKNILPEKKLSDAEKGLEKITFNQLVGLADRYHLPITYFYLENPFKSELVENFRTLNAQPISITPRLREILMELNEKRDLVIEYQTYDKEYDYSYVKSVSLQKIQKKLGKIFQCYLIS